MTYQTILVAGTAPPNSARLTSSLDRFGPQVMSDKEQHTRGILKLQTKSDRAIGMKVTIASTSASGREGNRLANACSQRSETREPRSAALRGSPPPRADASASFVVNPYINRGGERGAGKRHVISTSDMKCKWDKRDRRRERPLPVTD